MAAPMSAVRQAAPTQIRRRLRAGVVAGLASALVAGPFVAGPLTPANAGTRTLAEKMHDLRVCESSNNYRAHTGNGYYGAYQFALATWHSLGFSGRPDQRSKYTQDKAAYKLHRRQSWRPWPSCASSQHLYR
jgi:hypothetical protein